MKRGEVFFGFLLLAEPCIPLSPPHPAFVQAQEIRADFEKAKSFYDVGQFVEAISKLKRILDFFDRAGTTAYDGVSKADVHLYLGVSFIGNEEIDNAEREFRKMFEMNPKKMADLSARQWGSRNMGVIRKIAGASGIPFEANEAVLVQTRFEEGPRDLRSLMSAAEKAAIFFTETAYQTTEPRFSTPPAPKNTSIVPSPEIKLVPEISSSAKKKTKTLREQETGPKDPLPPPPKKAVPSQPPNPSETATSKSAATPNPEKKVAPPSSLTTDSKQKKKSGGAEGKQPPEPSLMSDSKFKKKSGPPENLKDRPAAAKPDKVDASKSKKKTVTENEKADPKTATKKK